MFDTDFYFEFAEMKRQLANMLQVVKVAAVDIENGRVTVSIGGEAESDYLPVLSPRSSSTTKSSWLPQTGEQVLVLALGGDVNFGFVVGSVPMVANSTKKASDYREYSDGTTIEYDPKTNKLLIDASKSKAAVLIKAKNVSVESEKINFEADKVKVKGEFTCDGQAAFTENVSVAKNVAVVQSVSSANVATGGLSAPPNEELTIGEIKGDIVATGDIKAGDVSLKNHTHEYIPGDNGPTQTGEAT